MHRVLTSAADLMGITTTDDGAGGPGAAMAWTGASALWRSLSGRMTAVRLNAMKNGSQPAVSAGPAHIAAGLRSTSRGAADQRLDWHCGRRQLSPSPSSTWHPTDPHRGRAVLASIAGVGTGDGSEERSRRSLGIKRGGSHRAAGETSAIKGGALGAELGQGLLLACTAVICGLSGTLARHV